MTHPTPVKILLVDDQPGKLLTYEAILQDLGETLLKATSAREALDLLLKNEIAVVLVDVCMPELDGYELASMIRQHPRFQKTAIIFISAILVTDLDRLRGYECGGVDYVPVPIVPDILRAKVSVFAELYRKTRELETLNNELEARVAERTAALEATTAALRDAGERKDEFLALLAHELRNPLAPIRTSVQLLRLEGLTPAQRERSRVIIERQVDHLVRLIDDLLDVSRISRGVITLRTETLDVGEVLARAVETTRPLIDARGLELSVDMPDGDLHVCGDSTRLAQAVGNLLHNATKFTEPSGHIWLSATRDGGSAAIRVRDDGAGIPADMLSRIFEMFVQVDRGNGTSLGGLGLGLALVRRLIELHGGAVEAVSAGIGHGTEVIMRLPLVDAPAGATRGLATPSAGSARPFLRVLVVDDNRDAADALGLLIQLHGHDVRIAYDGPQALEAGPAFDPHVVLLDLGMPDLDGFETARQMRLAPWGRRAMVVALTGWGQSEDRRRTSEAGFDLHLVKPVGDVELVSALARCDPDARPASTDGVAGH
ncbi:MAG TPA: response regulator [Vicinamibacterales bacterium]|nr:response regulator [Vicinamibacterales bacterium]